MGNRSRPEAVIPLVSEILRDLPSLQHRHPFGVYATAPQNRRIHHPLCQHYDLLEVVPVTTAATIATSMGKRRRRTLTQRRRVIDAQDALGTDALAGGLGAATRQLEGTAGTPNFDLQVSTQAGERFWINASTIVFDIARTGR